MIRLHGIVEVRTCTRCRETKPIEDFAINEPRGGAGHYSICKACVRRRYRNDPNQMQFQISAEPSSSEE